MSNVVATNAVTQAQEQQGLGLVTFFENNVCSALIRPYSTTEWQRGGYVPSVGLSIANEHLELTLKRVEHCTENGPRMRGLLVMRETGESTRVVAWRAELEDGTLCLGLSADRPMPNRIAAPF